MITVYMQLCKHSDYSNVKQSVWNQFHSFSLLLLCRPAIMFLPFCTLVATLSQLLHSNIQAVHIATMHERQAIVKSTTDHTGILDADFGCGPVGVQ